MNDEDLNKAVWNPIEEAAKSEGISVDEYTKRELIDPEIEALHASGFFNLAVTEANNLLANVYNADLEIKKLSAKLAKTESEAEQKLIKKQISDAEKTATTSN